MKKNNRKELKLEAQTIRTLSKVEDRDLAQVVAGVYALSQSCYTRYNSGCP